MSLSGIAIMAAMLYKDGPCTTPELAKRTGFSIDYVSDSLRNARNRKQYGLASEQFKAQAHSRRGAPCNVWSVDKAEYLAYIQRTPVTLRASRKKRPTLAVSPETKRSTPNIPASQFKTVWQATSPYHKEITNEHQNAAPGA